MPSPCRDPAVALRGRFQKGIFVAWQGNGMACVNKTRPRCVNQMGKTQSKVLAERHGRKTAWKRQGNSTGTAWGRHGMCESAFSGFKHATAVVRGKPVSEVRILTVGLNTYVLGSGVSRRSGSLNRLHLLRRGCLNTSTNTKSGSLDAHLI
jgi:hypothetical protein